MKRRIKVLLPLILLLGGCSALDTRVAESSALFADQVGSDYLEYVDADPMMTETQRELRHSRVTAQRELLAEVLNRGE
ncbi:MAG: hypothetical protein COA69_09460 [Robiginitomaculum sp.]|nr:MAG: hypothetical protein COA69_09460 [Robiginitomaculum sp.]